MRWLTGGKSDEQPTSEPDSSTEKTKQRDEEIEDTQQGGSSVDQDSCSKDTDIRSPETSGSSYITPENSTEVHDTNTSNSPKLQEKGHKTHSNIQNTKRY